MSKNSISFISKPIIFLIMLVNCFFNYSNHTLFVKKIVVNTFVNQYDIKWVRMKSTLGMNSKILFAGHDDVDINNIVKLINSGKNLGKPTYIFPKGQPLFMQIRENDGNDIVVEQFDETTPGISGASTSKDKVLLYINKNNNQTCSLIESKPLAEFISGDFNKIMPEVPLDRVFSIAKTFEGKYPKEGDTIKISGDSCAQNEFLIYICSNSYPSPKYYIGKVNPVYGKWTWSTIIKKNMKAIDGTEFTIGNGFYDIGADFDDCHRCAYGIINFDNSK